MEIDASKRVRPRGETRPLHQRLTRRRVGQQRLLYGSVLALALALVGWLVGLEWPVQVAVAALGLAAGALWRFQRTARTSERWAFGWIEERLGLSYQTAVELQGGDAHGLGEAVRARAARANTLELPPLQPWYLPLLLITLLLITLPHFVLPELRTPLGSLLNPLRTPQIETPVETPQVQVDVPPPDLSLENPNSSATAPQTGSAPEAARPGSERDNADSPSFDTNQDAEQGAAQAQGEAAALEQFLQQSQAPTGGSRASGNTGETTPEGRAEQEPGAQGNESGGEQQTGGGQEGQQRQAQEPGEDGQGGQGNAPQGNKPNPAGAGQKDVQQAAGNSAQPQQVPADEKMRNTGRTAQESERNNEQTSTEGVDMLQMRNSASREKENLNQMVRDGEASERAGTGPGADIESSRERLGGNTNQAERLAGESREGRSTTERSAVLEQGQVPTSLPQVGTPQSYQRATEEVIREGRIPAEYQNIVRDYFR